jgi:hypothetical protein
MLLAVPNEHAIFVRASIPFGVSEIDPKGSCVDGSHVYAEVEMYQVP